MPTGVYERSKEAIEKNRVAHLKENLSDETLKKIRIAGLKNWQDEDYKEHMSEIHKGKPGYWKDKHHSQETKLKIKNSLEGNIPWNKGETGIYSEETLEKMSKSREGKCCGIDSCWFGVIGKNHPVYGRHHTKEEKEKIRKSKLGDKNPSWKGGISTLRNKIRNSDKYKKWRFDVYCRDDFTCQGCGDKGKKLNAHHIKNFSKILQYYEITTLEEAMLCEEFWDINNGITLCEKCHKKMKEKVYAS